MKDLLEQIESSADELFQGNPGKSFVLTKEISLFKKGGNDPAMGKILETLEESKTSKAQEFISLLKTEFTKATNAPGKNNAIEENTSSKTELEYIHLMPLKDIIPHPVANGFFPIIPECVDSMVLYLREHGLDAVKDFPPLLLCTDPKSNTPRQWGGFQRKAAYKKSGIKGKVAVQIRHFESDDAIITGMIKEDMNRRQDNAIVVLRSLEYLFENETKASKERQGVKIQENPTLGRNHPNVGKSVDLIAKKTGKSEHYVRTVKKILNDEALKKAGLNGDKDLKQLFHEVNYRQKSVPPVEVEEDKDTQFIIPPKTSHSPSPTTTTNNILNQKITRAESMKKEDNSNPTDNDQVIENSTTIDNNDPNNDVNSPRIGDVPLPAISLRAFFRRLPKGAIAFKDDQLKINVKNCSPEIKQMIESLVDDKGNE